MNPGITIPSNAIKGIWLSSPSVSGGKDWLCFSVPNGVITFWGKTGHINRENFNEGGDYWKLINSKFQEGYTQVDVWEPKRGWESEASGASSLPAQQAAPLKKSFINNIAPPIEAPEWF